MWRKRFDIRPCRAISKGQIRIQFIRVGFSFQQRIREHLLHDSAPQRCCQTGEHSPRGQRFCGFTSVSAGCPWAGGASYQSPLPDPKTGTDGHVFICIYSICDKSPLVARWCLASLSFCPHTVGVTKINLNLQDPHRCLNEGSFIFFPPTTNRLTKMSQY